MSRRRLTRRSFLRGAGGTAIALPFMAQAFRGNPAFAADPVVKPPKRFIFMIHPNGVITEKWFPLNVTSPTSFDLNVCHAPLAPYKDKLNLFKGVHISCAGAGPGEPHQKGMGAMLSGWQLQEGSFIGGDGSRAGWGNGQGIDQMIASTVGAQNAFGSLELGVRADTNGGSEVRTRVAYAGPGQPLPPQNDPLEVFKSLFSDFMTDPTAIDGLQGRQASVLDAAMDQFDLINRKASAADRTRLDQHLTMVRDIERRLKAENITGAACIQPDSPEDIEHDDETTMPKITKAQIDLMIMAMTCDLTRVATLQISNAKNHIRYPWVNSLGDGHGLSHAGGSNTDAINQWVARDVWHAEQIAYMCQRLSEIPEGEGTMMDNTLIMWCSEIARGNTHSQRNMPFLTLGDAGGYFKTGGFHEYQDRPHNDLLLSIMHAFGQEDMTTIGNPDFCTGPLSGIT